eukprot:m.692804 g.692804  ORF g.692804 m.692804 type:complete len:235 (-) comp58651_c0_seq6:4696-5400(-)
MSCLSVQRSVKLGSEGLAVQFAPDGSHFAIGCADGSIQVRSSTAPHDLVQTLKADDVNRDTVTVLKFRPLIKSDTTHNLLLATYASGIIKHWHTTSGKCLASFPAGTEALTALDYAQDGTRFAIGGGDFLLRIFDAQKLLEVSAHGAGMVRSFAVGQVAPEGHTNRVFVAKFHPSNSNLVVSGGWDKTVQVHLSDSVGALAPPSLWVSTGLGSARAATGAPLVRSLHCRRYSGL